MQAYRSVDVIIVGGGVIGSSIAYELSLRGISSLVLERNEVASEASSAAAGMLAAQAEFIEEAPLLELALKSRAMFPQLIEKLKEQSGMDIGSVNQGLLRIAMTEKNVLRYQEQAKHQHRLGLSAEWLTKEQTLELEPLLASSIEGALFIEHDAQVVASQLTKAYAKAAVAQGAQLHTYAEVQELLYHEGKIKGVRVQNEHVFCEKVVIASSIWSTQLLQSAGYDLPLSSVKGECIAVRLADSWIRRTIYTDGCYLVPKANGELIIGATVKPRVMNKNVTLGGLSALIQAAEQLVPSIRESELIRAWSGLRPLTPTGLPYIGEHPEIEGLFIATGHYRNGILLSPATGVMIADLIEGKPLEEHIRAFAIPAIRYEKYNKQGGSKP